MASMATSTTDLTRVTAITDRCQNAEHNRSTTSTETKRAMDKATWAMLAMMRVASTRCPDSGLAVMPSATDTARVQIQI